MRRHALLGVIVFMTLVIRMTLVVMVMMKLLIVVKLLVVMHLLSMTFLMIWATQVFLVVLGVQVVVMMFLVGLVVHEWNEAGIRSRVLVIVSKRLKVLARVELWSPRLVAVLKIIDILEVVNWKREVVVHVTIGVTCLRVLAIRFRGHGEISPVHDTTAAVSSFEVLESAKVAIFSCLRWVHERSDILLSLVQITVSAMLKINIPVHDPHVIVVDLETGVRVGTGQDLQMKLL